MTQFHVVHGDHYFAPPRNFMGSELRSPDERLIAYCGPFDYPEPLELAAELLNIGAIVPETAKQTLKNCKGIFVINWDNRRNENDQSRFFETSRSSCQAR